MEETILKLISSNCYGIYNKEIAKKLGLETAIILGELASEYDYYKKKNELDEEGWFYSTTENIEENTTLNYYYQKKAIDDLINKGILEQKLKGIPAKRYFRFNLENVKKIFEDNNSNDLNSSFKMSEKLDTYSVKTNNNNINSNNNNYYNTTTKEAPPKEQDIYSFIEQNFGRTLAPIEYLKVKEWGDSELVRYAISKAVLNNKCNINYIDKIIYYYKRNNIQSVKQAQEKEEEFLNNKKRNEYRYMSSTEKANKEQEDFEAMLDRVLDDD